MTSKEIIMAHLTDVLNRFRDKAIEYANDAEEDDKKRYLRVRDIKNAIRSIGTPDTYGVGLEDSDYSACPSGICAGGICYGFAATPINDAQLVQLAQELHLMHEDYVSR